MDNTTKVYLSSISCEAVQNGRAIKDNIDTSTNLPAATDPAQLQSADPYSYSSSNDATASTLNDPSLIPNPNKNKPSPLDLISGKNS